MALMQALICLLGDFRTRPSGKVMGSSKARDQPLVATVLPVAQHVPDQRQRRRQDQEHVNDGAAADAVHGNDFITTSCE